MTFKEIRKLSYPQYYKLWLAKQYQKSEQLDVLRSLETTIFNFGGMGVDKIVTPLEWLKLPLLDIDNVLLPIRDKKRAIELYMSIVNG